MDGTDLSAGEKFFGGVSYLGVLAIGTLIIALMSGDNRFVKHHALQGMVLSVVFIVLEAVGVVLGGFIPGLVILIQILTIASWVIGFALAFAGQWFRIPLVADLADRVGTYLDDLVAEGRNRKHDELVETIDSELDRRTS